MYFLGLTMYVGFFRQPEFMFIWKTLSWVLILGFILTCMLGFLGNLGSCSSEEHCLVLSTSFKFYFDLFWFLQLYILLLLNNLGFSCINNIFLLVLTLGFWFWMKTHFDKKMWCLSDTTKRLMSSPKCRSVEVINNPARPGSNHREVNCINYR
jgi:hypothetical protein